MWCLRNTSKRLGLFQHDLDYAILTQGFCSFTSGPEPRGLREECDTGGQGIGMGTWLETGCGEDSGLGDLPPKPLGDVSDPAQSLRIGTREGGARSS